VARLSGIDDRNVALSVRGSLVGVPVRSFPPAAPGEYYWRELIGLRVVNSDGAPLGTIDQLIETGAHDVLVVKGARENRERLIPFVEQFVTSVDAENGLVRVAWTDFD